MFKCRYLSSLYLLSRCPNQWISLQKWKQPAEKTSRLWKKPRSEPDLLTVTSYTCRVTTWETRSVVFPAFYCHVALFIVSYTSALPYYSGYHHVPAFYSYPYPTMAGHAVPALGTWGPSWIRPSRLRERLSSIPSLLAVKTYLSRKWGLKKLGVRRKKENEESKLLYCATTNRRPGKYATAWPYLTYFRHCSWWWVIKVLAFKRNAKENRGIKIQWIKSRYIMKYILVLWIGRSSSSGFWQFQNVPIRCQLVASKSKFWH